MRRDSAAEASRRRAFTDPRAGLRGDDSGRSVRRGRRHQRRLFSSLRREGIARGRGGRVLVGDDRCVFRCSALPPACRPTAARARLHRFPQVDPDRKGARIHLSCRHHGAGGLRVLARDPQRVRRQHQRPCRDPRARHRRGDGALSRPRRLHRAQLGAAYAGRSARRVRAGESERQRRHRRRVDRPPPPLCGAAFRRRSRRGEEIRFNKGAATMTTKAIPDGMHTVTPHLICANASAAIEFYKKAFNATETSRLPGPSGRLMHASLRIGDSAVMLVDEMPEHGALGPKSLKGSPVAIHLYVEDADAVAARAVAAGAKLTMPVTDMFWGDRYGQLEDPFGHRWSIATHVRDVTPAEKQQAETGAAGVTSLRRSGSRRHGTIATSRSVAVRRVLQEIKMTNTVRLHRVLATKPDKVYRADR